VSGRRVRAVAVASSAVGRSRAQLRDAIRQLLAAKASAARPTYIPGQAQAQADATGQSVNGKTLAGSQNPRLNRALALLCSMQVQGTAGALTPQR
jgi:hypothetical protein